MVGRALIGSLLFLSPFQATPAPLTVRVTVV